MWTVSGSVSRFVQAFSPMLVASDSAGAAYADLPPPAAKRAAAASALEQAMGSPQKTRKARDRYIAARFNGVARCSAELRSIAAVIKSARLYFEEDRADLAVELLELASEESPADEALVLARIEILYLARERDEFVRVAAHFRRTQATSEAWPLVERLGRAIAPGEPLFGAQEPEAKSDHYGPWPDLPNWILAPWDLSAEVAAADFHRAVERMAERLAPDSDIAMLEMP